MQDAPSLEREDLVSSETRQRNDLKSLVPDLLPKNCVKPLHNSLDEKCDLNNGKCVDDGMVYRRKMRCEYSLGYMGHRCDIGEYCLVTINCMLIMCAFCSLKVIRR
ncbi:hypothetical protein DPMN_101192 [Dreissena polymorpha]|uniref:EGF-like domain-containing protein n=1 Tax=Dreissena polymorpha TaxID=45954 RepID=A0A9D4LIV4_DREPO|nr:hypothetical protein DPMN_101192 [Dreissena polymorpha]